MSDDWIHSAKQSSYHGRAKVMLGHFDLSGTSGTRTIREEHINSLVRVFESEGCMRSSPDNYVKVIVERNLLQQCLTGQGLSEAHLHGELQFLDFPSDFRLTLLHGKHRLLAAERFLWDKWWVAEFYSEDLPQDVRQFIHEEHPNAQRFSDGDIYQNIRISQTQGNVDAEIKWRGRLPGRVKKELDRMEKDFKRIQRGMDNLLPFKGLWNSLKLSYLGRWLSIKCPEEILHYLNRIHLQWSSIMQNHPAELLDSRTVSVLETLTPVLSLHDSAKIRDMMRRKMIFPHTSSENDRSQLLARILRTKGRILSFYTFIGDFTYFEACALTLKQLHPSKLRSTLSEAFMQSYQSDSLRPVQCQVQVNDDTFELYAGSSSVNPKLGYQQLFLAVMRDFPVLTNLSPYRDDRTVRPRDSGFRPERLYRLAQIALVLGFKSKEISEILGWSTEAPPYKAATVNFLLQLQPPDRFHSRAESRAEVAHYVGQNLSSTPISRDSQEAPEFTTDLDMQPKKLRCNRPSNHNYLKDRKFLFLDIIFGLQPPPRSHATSLALQRDIFVAFFGETNLQPAASDSVYHSSPEIPSQQMTTDVQIERSINPESIHDVREESPGGAIIPNEHYSQPPVVERDYSPQSTFETASISTSSNNHQGAFFLDPSSPLSINPARAFDSPELGSYQFKTIDPRMRPSTQIAELLRAEGTIILYLWESRKYLQFTTEPAEKFIFLHASQSLANEQHMFVGVRQDSRPFLIPVLRLYEAAVRERLILVGKKSTGSQVDGTLRSRLSQGLYYFIDQNTPTEIE